MKKTLAFLAVIMFTTLMFAVGEGGKETNQGQFKPEGHVCYKSIIMQVNAFAKQEKYEDAMKLLVEAKENPNYAGHVEHIYTSMAFINDKIKKYEDNIRVWNEGLDKGVTFPINPEKEEYRPYLKLKGFDEVAKKNAEYVKKGVKAKADCDNHEEGKKVEVK
ncbi:MAG: hypothetical protein JXR69_11485 [Candidatus Delongbacteria bacterium]|nr:hypothetical protein [Candidatus Delongbacteria bacterium]